MVHIERLGALLLLGARQTTQRKPARHAAEVDWIPNLIGCLALIGCLPLVGCMTVNVGCMPVLIGCLALIGCLPLVDRSEFYPIW